MNRIGDNLTHFGANEELVRALIAEGVEFVVIGGLAVSWYCPNRQADDMDLLVEPTSANSARIAAVLARLHLAGQAIGSFTRPGLQVPIKQVYYAELLTPKREGPTFEEVASDASQAKLFGMPVRVASPAALIRMKRVALESAETQRAKHESDIECLKQHAA